MRRFLNREFYQNYTRKNRYDSRTVWKKKVKMTLEHVGLDFKQNKCLFHALDDVNLKVYDRDFICLLGPSGCGKSSLLNVMAGYRKPGEGKVLLGGEAFLKPSAKVGVVFQHANLFPWLSVYKNVEFGLKQKNMDRNQRKDQVEHYLEIVGLTEAKDKLPHQLSGGMQQRAAIARTLATEPEFVLLDEPFSALDALSREKMQEHIRKIWEETGSTFLFITHDVDEALLLGKRLVVMQGNPGRIVSDYKNPLNKYENIDYEQLRQTKEYWKIRQKLIGQIQNDEEKKAEKLIQFG